MYLSIDSRPKISFRARIILGSPSKKKKYYDIPKRDKTVSSQKSFIGKIFERLFSNKSNDKFKRVKSKLKMSVQIKLPS